jgi:hypothetical protein
MIHDIAYVSGENHGDYVSKVKMGIKQDHTPLEPLKFD